MPTVFTNEAETAYAVLAITRHGLRKEQASKRLVLAAPPGRRPSLYLVRCSVLLGAAASRQTRLAATARPDVRP